MEQGWTPPGPSAAVSPLPAAPAPAAAAAMEELDLATTLSLHDASGADAAGDAGPDTSGGQEQARAPALVSFCWPAPPLAARLLTPRL